MRLFPADAPMEFVAIELLGDLIQTKLGNRLILVFMDRFYKLDLSVPLKTSTADSVDPMDVRVWTEVLVSV